MNPTPTPNLQAPTRCYPRVVVKSVDPDETRWPQPRAPPGFRCVAWESHCLAEPLFPPSAPQAGQGIRGVSDLLYRLPISQSIVIAFVFTTQGQDLCAFILS